VETECQKLKIEFHLLKGESQICVPDLIKKLKLDAVVADFSPLRVPLSWIDKVKESIPKDVPFCQVPNNDHSKLSFDSNFNPILFFLDRCTQYCSCLGSF
jgi:hypothetical protein